MRSLHVLVLDKGESWARKEALPSTPAILPGQGQTQPQKADFFNRLGGILGQPRNAWVDETAA
jgi:hypothetical protein